MERQDAIYWITNLIGRYGKEYDEALEMAESALRQSKLMEDVVSRQQVIDTIMGEPSETYYPCYFAEMIRELPAVQSERVWHSCKTPPKHHKDVLVRGAEAIGNVTIYKVMQWDVDAWRPKNYAPSITWEEWSEIYE